MPKVHGADKVVDPALKPKAQARGESIPISKPVITKSTSLSQRIVPPVLPTKGQGKADARRKMSRPKLQPTQQPQLSPASPL